MARTALIICGGFGSPDLEWNLSPIKKMSTQEQYSGVDIFIFRKCSNGLGNIDHNGHHLAKYVESVRHKGYGKIFLLGHSMGGLVVRRAELYCHKNIDGVITIATPHYGTVLAQFAPNVISKSINQMRLNSRYLDQLNENPVRSPVYSIACRFDELVFPFSSAIYKDSAKVSVYNMTHVMPVFSRRVAADVLSWVHDNNH